MATFTWTATTSGKTTSWETTSAWFDTSGADNPSAASFTASPGNDYVINTSNVVTILIGGTAGPDTANSITDSQSETFLLLTDGDTLDVTNTLTLDGLLNLGKTTGGSVLSMGGTAGGGTISLGPNSRLEGALNDIIQDAGTSPTQIVGGGTVIAEGGLFQIGPSVQVATGATTQFQINAAATLAFADAVGGGTIVFASGVGTVLDVAELSTFQAKVKGLFAGAIANTPTNYVDFLNVGTTATANLSNVTSAGATITVFTNGGSQAIPILGNYVGKFVNYVSDGNNGTNVFMSDVPCYAAGTAILTPDGEVAVERIQRGDVVMTSADGMLVPQTVIWAGSRTIDLTRHPSPASVAPIRFHTGALGPDLPKRELLLSPDHCLFIDGALFPAKLLINGMTIIRDLSPRTVTYHHIELARHAVLIAEGVEAESYLDTGNRAFFSNAGLTAILHPELEINEHLHCWETDACAPLTVRPEAVKPVWDRLASRAVALGFTPPEHATTTDTNLRLLVDGRIVRPLAAPFAAHGHTSGGETARQRVSFVVPEGARSVRLMSRSINPVELRPWHDDPRRLGVAVRSVMLRDRSGETVLGADHPALTDGWHLVEHGTDGAPWRWSEGDAGLPIVSDGPCVVEITLADSTTYLDEAAA